MVYMLLGNGFEEMEAVAPLDILRRAGIQVQTVGISGKFVRGSHDICVEADISMEELNLSDLEMIIVPGGRDGVAAISACQKALDALKFTAEHGKFVAAICAGPSVLASLGITDGKKATCYPGWETKMGNAEMVPGVAYIRDGNIITGTSAGCSIPFGLALVETLKGPDAAKEVAELMVIR